LAYKMSPVGLLSAGNHGATSPRFRLLMRIGPMNPPPPGPCETGAQSRLPPAKARFPPCAKPNQ